MKLYYAVRDEILYDPYRDFTQDDTYRASAALLAGRGYCVAKAALLAAAGRAVRGHGVGSQSSDWGKEQKHEYRCVDAKFHGVLLLRLIAESSDMS